MRTGGSGGFMIRKYLFNDALAVCVQQAQQHEANDFADAFNYIEAYTLQDQEGNVLAVCGFSVDEEGCAECFALIGKNIGKYLLQLVRFLKIEIPRLMIERCVFLVRMTVKKGFKAGERMACLLGFSYVKELPLFYMNCDYLLFERRNYGFTNNYGSGC